MNNPLLVSIALFAIRAMIAVIALNKIEKV